MMGIGFGRESSNQQPGTPDYNPFLNLRFILQNGVITELPLDWCNGYVVTRTRIFLGLTSSNTANAGFVKLMPWLKHSTQKLNGRMPAKMKVFLIPQGVTVTFSSTRALVLPISPRQKVQILGN